MFYIRGCLFILLEILIIFCAFKSASQLLSYVPLKYNTLRTTLLQNEKSNIENLL